MNNKLTKIAAILLAGCLILIIMVIASDVITTEASPFNNPATSTPVPTEVPSDEWWWTHEVIHLTKSHPGVIGLFWSDTITAQAADETIEAVVFQTMKTCPDENGHAVKVEWKKTDGGSWATTVIFTDCNDTKLSWWNNTYGKKTYNERKTEIESVFGSIGGGSTRDADGNTETDFKVGTSAGTNGDEGFTGQVDIYYLHYGEGRECSEDITLGSEPFAEGVIDATLEGGIQEALAEGGHYAVEITGGPWDDGFVGRYDVAYSWDGEEWIQLDGQADDVSCVDDVIGGQIFYFEAQSDLLYLRVNDEADAFDDNADDMDYAIYSVVGLGETGCGGNYTMGSLVFDESWDATFEWDGYPGQKYWPGLINETGVYFENYDMYRILIPHTYQDGSQYNAEAQLSPLLEGNWSDLATHEQTVCVEDHDDDLADSEGWVSYYFESPEDFTTYSIRADDLDGDADSDYNNNAGGFQVQVYEATYNPPVAGCAAGFTDGPLIQSIMITADAENGIRIPDPLYAFYGNGEDGLIVDVAYMIEEPTTWYGFGDNNYFNWQISTDRSSWVDKEDFADCISPIDNNHDRYYFDAEVEEYYIRAADYDEDGTWADQPGLLRLNLYYADDIRTDPDVNGTCPNLALGDSQYSGNVDSQILAGGYLPDIFTPGQLYGIQMTTPPWTDDSVDQKVAEFKLAGDASWQNFEDYDGAICSETDGNDWPLVWIQALDDATYMMRADDSIGDNAGYVNYTIYEADWITDPVYPSCEGDYNPINFADFPVASNVIPANWKNGQYWQDFVLRQGVYKVTTEAGPWSDIVLGYPPLTSYDLEISTANGAENTWEDLEDAAVCYVRLSDGDHARAYIEIEEGYNSITRLRVDNLDAFWIDNAGEMEYSLQYSAQGVDPDAPWDPYDDENGFFKSGGCNLVCVSPGSGLNVPAWLEYFRCQLMRRLSFCPYHIEVLQSMRALFYDREPFGSIQELGQSLGIIRANVDAYAWSDDQGGDPPEVGYPENFIFASPDGGGANLPIVGEDTIWGSGSINILGEGETFSLTCTNNMASTLGTRLAQPFCFAFNVIEGLGLSSWFQLFWDLVMLIAIGMYFQNRWLKPMSS